MPARRSSQRQAAGGHGRVWPVLFVVATGVVVAALAFVTTAAAARILLADGPATVLGAGCPRGRLRAALSRPGGTAGHPDRWARVPGGHWLAQHEASAVKIRGAVARQHVGEEHAACGRARGRV